ncbi:MAG: DUF1992 domain-containing protein [Brachybacterium sp.]|nr:DUF1992 domain-containing protein [Brachybacterium sp.]MDN6303341.1 DUF1992 domain-containing protein [Brachybacterium sp.]
MMAPDVARIESAIEQAARRGDFDDLPGAGKPLDLPSSHDPDWWINQRIASGDIDRQALLPVVVLLRKEFENRDETLAALPHERAAREYAEEFTERVHQDRRENPFQTMLAPAWDPDDAVQRWREVREQGLREPRRRSAASEPPTAPSPRRRRWWPFGRRG